MRSRPTAHYDALSRAFHWLTAIVVTIAFVLGPEHFGREMHNGLDPATRSDIVWHETLGVAVFVLTALRLVWVALRPAGSRTNCPLAVSHWYWMGLPVKRASLKSVTRWPAVGSRLVK